MADDSTTTLRDETIARYTRHYLIYAQTAAYLGGLGKIAQAAYYTEEANLILSVIREIQCDSPYGQSILTYRAQRESERIARQFYLMITDAD